MKRERRRRARQRRAQELHLKQEQGEHFVEHPLFTFYIEYIILKTQGLRIHTSMFCRMSFGTTTRGVSFTMQKDEVWDFYLLQIFFALNSHQKENHFYPPF